MKKKIFSYLALTKICCLFVLTMLSASCNGWLDVQPKTEVKEEKLFLTESGFIAAQTGVYTLMASKSLYGSELTMSFLDVLAQYYEFSNQTFSYYHAQQYAYGETVPKSTIEGIWSQMYKAIANANNVLAHLDSNASVLTPIKRQVMRGEMLGARALMHFDLLRLFAPSPSSGTHMPAIPYVDAVSRTPFRQLNAEQVLTRIEQDCASALEALADVDPMSPTCKNVSLTSDEQQFLQHREEHINWQAVRALQCRIALWRGDYARAENLATELLSLPTSYFANPLFALYSDKLSTYSEDYFAPRKSGSLELQPARIADIYEYVRYGNNDRRSQIYVAPYPNSTSYFVSRWYASNNLPATSMPILTTAELHYIKAECLARRGDDEAAVQVLNDIRGLFGLSSFPLQAATCDALEEIQKDFRKHFIGLGQLFYFYKRNNLQPIPGAPLGTRYEDAYTLPLPDDEIEFGELI